MRTITLISKDECSLCDKALETLERIRAEKPFQIDVRKIEPGMPEYEKYKEKIPVIIVDGKEMFYYRLGEHELRSLL